MPVVLYSVSMEAAVPQTPEYLHAFAIILPAIALCWGLCRLFRKGSQLALLPDFLLYICAGFLVKMACGAFFPDSMALLSKENDSFVAIQFAALFFFMVPSCANLRFEGLGSHAKEVGSLVTGCVLAFFLALISAPAIAKVAPDPFFVDADENIRFAHFLVLSLGAMVTSIPFLTKILLSNGLLKSRFGKSLLLSACIVDVVVWIIFSIALSISSSGGANIGTAGWQILRAIALMGLTLGVGIPVARWGAAALPRNSWLDFFFALAVTGGTLTFTVLVGLEPIVGMVLAGLVAGSARDHIAEGLDRLEN
ncbi:MAG: cation:proton antiporter [Agrobacterium tumefaciens]